MGALKDRIGKLNIESGYIDDLIVRMKEEKNLYVFGGGDRAVYLFDFLQKRGVSLKGFLLNESYLEKGLRVSAEKYKDIITSFEKKLQEKESFSIVLGLPQSVLNMKMFDTAEVSGVYTLACGVTSDYLIDATVYASYADELDWLYSIVEDDYSREILYANLVGRLTGRDVEFKPSAWSDPEYFMPDLMQWHEWECLMDGGAYVGDTVEEFMRKMDKGVLDYKVYAWEPDEKNYKVLLQKFGDTDNVIPICKGMYSINDKLSFTSSGDERSCISNNGNIEIEVGTIDEVAQNTKVTFIKMDIEGSELEALKGARHQIVNNTPQIAVCLYHKQEDMWTIPQYIYSLNKSYKFYLRTHSNMPTELVLFCVPQ